jgi:diaminopimelate epimerase
MAKTIDFEKWQGLGNDFVIIDGRSGKPSLAPKAVRFLGDRRYGVGFDQMMIVRRSRIADYKMDLFNSDGSLAEMCGNGIRCFHRFLVERGATGKKRLSVETRAGIIKTTLLSGGMVEVDMGEPILDGPQIPVNLEGRVVDRGINTEMGAFRITAVSMGNPHIIIFTDDLEKIDLDKLGPFLENHPLFPKRTNVHFARMDDAKNITVRHWERGAGATLACGTGACATAVAAVLNNLSGRAVTVRQRGGALKIRWNERDDRVYMTGPADRVFSGKISV